MRAGPSQNRGNCKPVGSMGAIPSPGTSEMGLLLCLPLSTEPRRLRICLELGHPCSRFRGQGSSYVSRNTKQRAVVLDAVRSLHNHPTSADIYDVVHRDHPNVSRATVYRNLSVLSERGEVLRIPVPNAADRYDFRCDNHFHAKCSRCGGVFDIETEGVDPFARIVNDYGFQVTGFDLAFSGVCPDCRRNSGE